MTEVDNDIKRQLEVTERVVTTLTLMELSRRARSLGFNKVLPEWLLAGLDDQGHHVLTVATSHHEVKTGRTLRYHRLQVLLDLKGGDPVISYLDVALGDWDALVTATETVDVVTELVRRELLRKMRRDQTARDREEADDPTVRFMVEDAQLDMAKSVLAELEQTTANGKLPADQVMDPDVIAENGYEAWTARLEAALKLAIHAADEYRKTAVKGDQV